MMNRLFKQFLHIAFALVLLLAGGLAYGQFPVKPSPPRLVNDMANMLSPGEQNQLERKLLDFERETSNQITIVTIDSLGDYDVSDYAIKLGKAWGIGKAGRNNGIVILASARDHKINISTGQGLEGALTDLMCGRIIRNEMVPAFKEKNYYEGFSKAADAVLAATRGEYKADPKDHHKKGTSGAAILVIIIIIVFVIKMMGRGGGGGGNYMSGGGMGNFLGGMILGEMLGGGRGGGGGGGDSDGGGFGGFGGGDFGGGGASGSW